MSQLIEYQIKSRNYNKSIRCDVIKVKHKNPQYDNILKGLKIISNEIRKHPKNVRFDIVYKTVNNLLTISHDIDYWLNVSISDYYSVLESYEISILRESNDSKQTYLYY